MKKPFSFFAWIVVVSLGGGHLIADAGRPGSRFISRPSVVGTVEKESKLSSDLRELARRHRSGDAIRTFTVDRDLALAEDDTIQVVVQTTVMDLETVKEYLRKVGGHFQTSAGNLVLARVPVASLDALANAGPAVQIIRRPRRPVPFRTTSEGVDGIGAAAWHAAGRRGGGIKVAILDVGFDGYRSLMGSDLPQIPDARVRSFSGDITGDGSEHGTGVAEIVYDVAPDAILYLVNFSNEVELQNAVDWLIQEGVDVINTSWGYPCGGPADGTGFVNELVKRASDAGIAWVASAGNFAQQHWMGDFHDSNGDTWHNFSSTEEGNTVYLASGDELRVCVEWDDWTNRNQDLDLFVWNGSGSVVASSDENQSGPSTHDPWERLEFTANTAGDYYIGIKRYSGTRNVRLHLYAYEPGDECAIESVAETQAMPRGILKELRRFRDDVLAESPAGRTMIRSYYRHSREVRRILLRHPALAIEAARLLRDLRPAVRSLLDGGTVDITEDQATRIDAFVAELTVLAGPELRDALTELRGRAGISAAAGQTAVQYWRTFLKEDRLWPAVSNYPEAGYMYHRVEQTSLAPPADSAHALTIGAVNVGTGTARQFSSQGPSADGRRKPDLAAPDGVCTTTYGDCGAGGFVGTSAAAPHAAGAVALVWSAYPSLGVSGVRDFLLSRAMDVAPAGPDNVTGAGRLALEASGPDVFPAPGLSSPKGNGVPLSPTYIWSEIAGASSYRLMIAASVDRLPKDPASQTCSGCVVNTTRTAPYFVPPTCLLPDTTYYWQVQATAGNKNGLWARSSFQTTTAPERTLPTRGDLHENPGPPPFAARAVVITHGYNADVTSWVQNMATGICVNLGGSGTLLSPNARMADSFTRVCTAGGWDVWVVDWRDDAAPFDRLTPQTPIDVLAKAVIIGERLASRLTTRNYEHVHFIAHSAGSALIQSATTRLKRTVPGVKIHDTFLDAFDPVPVSRYGSKADWADNYVDTRSLIGLVGNDGTKLFLSHAFNVDVTSPDNDACGMTCRHNRPYRFYGKSINDSFADLPADRIHGVGGTGFDLSIEKGKTLSWLQTSYPRNLTCTMAGETCDYSVAPPRATAHKKVQATRSVTTFGGPVTFTLGSASLFDSIKLGSAPLTSALPADTSSVSSAGLSQPPAWIVVDVSPAEPVSTLRFHWRFRAAGEGFLRVFADGRLVREMDQRHLSTASNEAEEVYIGGPEGALPAGTHTIVFRLDGFGTAESTVELMQVELIGIGPAKRRVARH
ncbi:MAG TPA: S8 family serine peptidase [Thermoanaerobaculia bacterium]